MANTNTNLIPASLLYDGAGYIQLARYTSAGVPSTDPKDIYTSGPVLAGAIDNAWSKATTDIADENSEYPGAQRGGQVTSTVTANFNTFDPDFDRFTKGAEKTIEEDHPIRYMNRSYSVGSLGGSAGFGFVLNEVMDSVSEDEPVLVRDATTNSDLTAATSKTSLATGQYFVDAATKTVYMAEADAGKSVYVSFTGIVAQAVHYEYPEGRAMISYQMILGGYVSDPNGSGESIWCQKTYDRVGLSGDANDPTRQMDPSSYSVTYSIQRPRAGHKAITVDYVPEA